MWNAGSVPNKLSLLSRSRLGLGIAAAILSVWQPTAGAQEPSNASSIKSDEAGERAKLFIALLKRRAERILEAHREPPPQLISGSAGISEGFESNVNLDGARKGDAFTEESASLLFRPQMTSWLKGEFSYSLLNTHFMEFRDSNLWSNSLSGVFQVQPHPRVRVDLGYEYGILNFPFDTDSNFFDQRFKAHLLFSQTSWLTHKAGWTYQYREYDTRLARDSDLNKIAGLNREDQRQVALYELQFRFPRTFARLGTEFYRNFSNDHFEDFYDFEDFRYRGMLTRIFSPKWIGTLSATEERKNYQKRSVPTINVAERDDLWTLAGSVIYQLNNVFSLTYSLTYRHQDSNDPRLDFTDWVHQAGISASF